MVLMKDILYMGFLIGGECKNMSKLVTLALVRGSIAMELFPYQELGRHYTLSVMYSKRVVGQSTV